jgi:hypothetical protein
LPATANLTANDGDPENNVPPALGSIARTEGDATAAGSSVSIDAGFSGQSSFTYTVRGQPERHLHRPADGHRHQQSRLLPEHHPISRPWGHAGGPVNVDELGRKVDELGLFFARARFHPSRGWSPPRLLRPRNVSRE